MDAAAAMERGEGPGQQGASLNPALPATQQRRAIAGAAFVIAETGLHSAQCTGWARTGRKRSEWLRKDALCGRKVRYDARKPGP